MQGVGDCPLSHQTGQAIRFARNDLAGPEHPGQNRLRSTRLDRANSVDPAQAAETRRSLRILLAEDGVTNQKVACGLLERRGHQVVVANNGREAVEAVERDAFDLVLMDVMMPEMDGFEATAAIRQMEQTTGKHIQIVAMTAHALKGDRERCLKRGDGCLSVEASPAQSLV